MHIQNTRRRHHTRVKTSHLGCDAGHTSIPRWEGWGTLAKKCDHRKTLLVHKFVKIHLVKT